MGDNKEIFNKIEKMYNFIDENGKQKNRAFFSHLIKSYLPKNSVEIAMENPKSKKTRVRCVFENKGLITVEGVLKENKLDSFRRNFNDFLSSFDQEKGCFVSVTTMKQLLKEKSLALQGNNTETYMSEESYAAFIGWTMTKFISGDKNIVWLLNQMLIKKIEFHPGITVKKKSKIKPQINPQIQSKTISPQPINKNTLGEQFSNLKNLKNKFNDQ